MLVYQRVAETNVKEIIKLIKGVSTWRYEKIMKDVSILFYFSALQLCTATCKLALPRLSLRQRNLNFLQGF